MKNIKTLLDRLWEKKIKELGFCEWCAKPKGIVQLHAHHIKRRGIEILRWDIKNGLTLCTKHHSYAHSTSYKQKEKYDIWLKENIEPYRLEYLNKKQLILANFTDEDYERIKKELKGF